MDRKSYEIVGDPSAGGPFVLTCEHATRDLPEWRAQADDLALLEDHWGWDVGAADLTRALARRTGSCAVLSRFSRLVCDPNRDPSEASFIVREIDGHALSFNRGLDPGELVRRQTRYFDPYHDAIDRTVTRRRALGTPVRLCAIHSFAPVYLGTPRAMEVGILFDDFDELAWRLQSVVAEQGFETALNAPYSGRDGLIYAARRHGLAHGLVYVELEVRQDLIGTPSEAAAVADRLAVALSSFAP